jgi:hypothetical protein
MAAAAAVVLGNTCMAAAAVLGYTWMAAAAAELAFTLRY